MLMGEYIKFLRKRNNLTQEELGKKLSPPVNRAAINKWESGQVENIKRSYIEQMSRIFTVKPHQLMCFEEFDGLHQSVTIPVLGRIAAGIPIDAIEHVIDYEEVDGKLAALGDLFGLKIKGDSMTPRICDKDVVIVHQQPDAESGDIVVATINGDDAVCKRLIKYQNAIVLRSTNPAYEDIDVTGREDFRIIGKVVELRGKV